MWRSATLPELLEVDHIDVFFVAPSDLGQSMGILDNASPEVVEVTEKAIRQIVAAGRVAGTLAFTPTVEHWIDVGARFLHPPWMPWLEQGAKEFLARTGNRLMSSAALSPRREASKRYGTRADCQTGCRAYQLR